MSFSFTLKLKDMKKLIYSIAALLLITASISCKKETKISTVGYWTGTLSDDGSPISASIGIVYKSDNTNRIFLASGTIDTSTALAGSGTYTIDADSVRSTVVIGTSTLTFNAKLNNTNTQMVGRFANITYPVNGNFSVTKN